MRTLEHNLHLPYSLYHILSTTFYIPNSYNLFYRLLPP